MSSVWKWFPILGPKINKTANYTSLFLPSVQQNNLVVIKWHGPVPKYTKCKTLNLQINIVILKKKPWIPYMHVRKTFTLLQHFLFSLTVWLCSWLLRMSHTFTHSICTKHSYFVGHHLINSNTWHYLIFGTGNIIK